MLSIVTGAKQILSDNPGKLYFLTGPEYGVKFEYINKLKSTYHNEFEEIASFDDLISHSEVKSLIPVPAKLYICRYDTSFISQLDTELSHKLANLKLSGTIVGVYSEDKHETKLDKFFPDNVLRINSLTTEQILKHLTPKYPKLPETAIREISEICVDYYQGISMCEALNLLDNDRVCSMSQAELQHLFGYCQLSSSEAFKLGVVSRNFKLLCNEIDNAESLDYAIYDLMSAMLDIIKCFDATRTTSYAANYRKLWSYTQAVYMFKECYQQLVKLRTTSSYSIRTSLMYLISLLNFKIEA